MQGKSSPTVEIRSHPQVHLFDYKGMLSLKTCLENNYAPLIYRRLEHEISNTHTLEFILKKFLIQENVKWNEHLVKTEGTVKEKPFPEFMKWLGKAGVSWDLLAAQGTRFKSGGGGKGRGA